LVEKREGGVGWGGRKKGGGLYGVRICREESRGREAGGADGGEEGGVESAACL